MELIFRKLGKGEMDRPPTQRDQFNNDDVELVDALVRESLQNSLDARDANGIVRVHFRLHDASPTHFEALARFLDLENLRIHLRATKMLPDDVDLEQCRLLVIEDFGTTGLTGAWDEWDKKPFCDFWRRMGVSNKRGGSLGRWGLGKLVFSSASQARIFFGLTVRSDDASRGYLMGQAVLTTHELDDGERYDSHGFFALPGDEDFQFPETSETELEAFRKACGLTREHEPGLSVVVPFAQPSITLSRIAQGALRNYFFPILMGRLELRIGEFTLDASTFGELARLHGDARFSDGLLPEFIDTMQQGRTGEIEPVVLPRTWNREPMEKSLGEHLDALRAKLASGSAVYVRAPLLLKRKDGSEKPTHVDLFLKRSPNERGDTLVVRDTIVLPSESKYFRGKNVFAALVADDADVCSFLGDAENPAHTSWSATAEKVTTNWRNSSERLKEVRGALQQLYGALFTSVETLDENALIDVFSVRSSEGASGRRPRGPIIRPTNIPNLPARPRAYRLSRLSGGFVIRADVGLTADELPIQIRVRTAYDVLRGNPFSKHDSLDFDFNERQLDVLASGATTSAQAPNVLLIEAHGANFAVVVRGFDVRRDLIVDPVRVS